MYRDRLEEAGESKLGARKYGGALLDLNPATLRNWVEATERADGSRPASVGAGGARTARPVSPAGLEEAYLVNALVTLWEDDWGVYGARKPWHAARRAGIEIGRDQVARLMKVAGITGAVRGRHRTGPDHGPGRQGAAATVWSPPHPAEDGGEFPRRRPGLHPEDQRPAWARPGQHGAGPLPRARLTDCETADALERIIDGRRPDVSEKCPDAAGPRHAGALTCGGVRRQGLEPRTR